MKPVFLTKSQRAELALERRRQEVLEAKKRVDDSRLALEKLKSNASSTSSSAAVPVSSTAQPPTKFHKTSERKFVFDWAPEEDTTAGDDLYSERMALTRPLFGRGRLGGMDNSALVSSSSNSSSSRQRVIPMNWKDKPLEAMTGRDWRIMLEELNISTRGGNIPHPIRTWDEASMHYRLKDTIMEVGYVHPTPIQRQAIPIALKNRDLIGVAETGSGKTAAFLVPLMEFLLRMPRLTVDTAVDGPYALIMAPTRELAQQIEREAMRFAGPLNFRCVSIVGGHSLTEQSVRLRDGAEIVIATPGRLRDVLERHLMVLNQCTYIVMDEADRMVVDMGFEVDLNFILSYLPVASQKPDDEKAELEHLMFTADGIPKYRQTTMFSATMPDAVERVAATFMRRPAIITVGEAGNAASRVEQRVEMIREDAKLSRLIAILSQPTFDPPIIVFVRQKIGVDQLSRELEQERFSVATLHGGKSQDMREQALQMVRNGRRDILIATDVAGRGIDIANVSLVVNYDMPKTIEDYTHRIGRTGRAGQSGVAISFVTPDDTHIYADLKDMLVKSNNTVPRQLASHEATRTRPNGGPAPMKRKHEETISNNW